MAGHLGSLELHILLLNIELPSSKDPWGVWSAPHKWRLLWTPRCLSKKKGTDRRRSLRYGAALGAALPSAWGTALHPDCILGLPEEL